LLAEPPAKNPANEADEAAIMGYMDEISKMGGFEESDRGHDLRKQDEGEVERG
jgi:hypothetical protein